MTALYIDGFEDGAFAARYTVAGTPTLVTGRFGSEQALQCSAGTTCLRAITAAAQVYCGFGYRATSTGSQQTTLFELFGDSGGTVHGSVRRETSGAISIYRGATQVAISAAAAVASNTWGYMEVTHTVSDTVGVLTVKWNGTQIVTFTGDTKNAGTATTIDSFRFGCTGASNVNQFDDLYVFNALGSVNNTYAGDSRIQTLVPNGAGSSTQWLPTGSANNWDNVDELPYSAVEYNASATSGNRDLYALTNLLTATSAVACVQQSSTMQKSDAGAVSVKNAVKSGGTVYSDASGTGLSVSPTVVLTLREQDPATSAAWTVANVNALEAGVEVA